MDLNEVEKLLKKYNIQTLQELEYFLDFDSRTNECADDDKLGDDKDCMNANCYEGIFLPDCRKIVEIYKKYFQADIKSKKLFIEYLFKNTSKSISSIDNYMSCKSCNQQMKKGAFSSLKISDSDFKKNFCKNLERKFDYITLFETDYDSVKQFLNKEHEVTRESFQATFSQEGATMNSEEKKRLFDLIHVSRDVLKANLMDISKLEGSIAFKTNLAFAAFDRNLIDESNELIDDIVNENGSSSPELLQLKAKILSSKRQDKEAMAILEKLVEKSKPSVDAETYNLLAASIKREAFDEFEKYSDEETLQSKLIKSKNIYFSVYSLTHDYYPALNYMYLVLMLSYISQDTEEQINQIRNSFNDIWESVDHVVNDWWSFIADVEYLVLLGDYQDAKEKLKTHFDQLEEMDVSEFNVLSTIRQLKLYANFCNEEDLSKIIKFLEETQK